MKVTNGSSVVFVYTKNGEIQVVDFDTAVSIKDDLQKDGWKHAATLNSIVFVEYIVAAVMGGRLSDVEETIKGYFK